MKSNRRLIHTLISKRVAIVVHPTTTSELRFRYSSIKEITQTPLIKIQIKYGAGDTGLLVPYYSSVTVICKLQICGTFTWEERVLSNIMYCIISQSVKLEMNLKNFEGKLSFIGSLSHFIALIMCSKRLPGTCFNLMVVY